MPSPALHVHRLGLVPYDEAWALQKDTARRRISGELAHDTLLLVQHPPVVTLGRSTKPGHLLASAESLEARGIQVRDVERGGDVTIHEPGQLVAYPIVDLKQHKQDLHWHLRQLEEAVIRALATVGLAAERVAGLTGVWIGDAPGLDGGHREPVSRKPVSRKPVSRKLASIGVHARDWVTWHGVALNVCNDLATFDHTVPCGIDGVTMTTVARECTRRGLPIPSFATVETAVAQAMAEVFSLTVVEHAATV